MKGFIRILILLSITILVVGYVYFCEIKGVRGDGEKQRVAQIFYLNVDDIDEIKILKKDRGEVFLKKLSGQWRMVAPFQAIVNDKKIFEIAAIFDKGIVGVMCEDISNISQYGLNNPVIKLSIKSVAENKPKVLLVGNNNPVNDSCYVMVKGGKKVYQVGILYKTQLDEDFSGFSNQNNKNYIYKLLGKGENNVQKYSTSVR